MASTLSVKVTADVVDLQVKFATAKAEVSSLTSELNKLARQSAEGIVGSNTTAQMQNVSAALAEAKANAAGLSQQFRAVTESSADLGGSVEAIRNSLSNAMQLTGIGAALEGMRMLGAEVTQLGERATQIRSMADVLGVSTAQMQAMSVAAEESGVGIEVLNRAAEKLRTVLDDARDGSGAAIEKLRTLGITQQELASSSFGVNDMLGVLRDRLNDGTTSQAEMNALVKEFGARAALAAEAIKAYDGSIGGVAEKNREVGALTDQQITRLKEEGNWWKSLGTEAKNAMSTVVIAMGGANSMDTGFQNTKARLLQEAQAAKQNAEIQEANQNALTEVYVTSDKIMTASQLNAEHEQVEAMRSGSAQKLAAAQQYYADSQAFYGHTDVDKVQAPYREELAAQREFDSASKASAEANARTQAELARQLLAANETVYGGMVRMAEDAARQKEAIDRQNVAADIEISRSAIEAKKSIVESEVATTATAVAQKYSLLKQFAAQEYALDLQSLQDELATLSDQPAAYNRVFNEIRVLKAKEVADLAALDHQAAAGAEKAAQDQTKGWKDALGEIENAEGQMVSNLLTRRKSLAQSLISMSAQLATQEITNDLRAITTRLAMSHAADASQKALEQGGYLYHQVIEMLKTNTTKTQQTAQTTAVVTGNSMRNSATASAAASGMEQQAAVNSQTIGGDAAKTFAGVFSGVSQIPYGWIIAPALASAAMAEVSSMGSKASLDVGAWNIPYDMPANIHKGEMVVPENFAEGARRNGFGLGADSGGGGDTHYHEHNWNLSMLDGSSFQRFASDPIVQRRVSHFIASRTVPGVRGGNARMPMR
jgi:hypothetical protein